jgi:hypothetical protein
MGLYRLGDLSQSGAMAAPGANLAFNLLKFFGYIVAAPAMAAAECAAEDPSCTKTNAGMVAMGIIIPEARLTKVLEAHTAGGLLSAGKSLFNEGEDVKSLIQAADSATTRVKAGGNVERIVDAEETLGQTRALGCRHQSTR